MRILHLLPIAAALLAQPSLAQTQITLSPADKVAAFRAAGFARTGGTWQKCGDPGTMSYSPGSIEQVLDLNGDGRPEAVVTEGSVYCHGNTGRGYDLVSKQPGGKWKLITSGTGMVSFVKTKGVGGWPDIQVGGPGFCFPVERWNGKTYRLHRHEYEGKRCRPPRM